jgi:hypothetical protein
LFRTGLKKASLETLGLGCVSSRDETVRQAFEPEPPRAREDRPRACRSTMICYGAGRVRRPSGIGTPDSLAALSVGDKIECGVDDVAMLKDSIGQPA